MYDNRLSRVVEKTTAYSCELILGGMLVLSATGVLFEATVSSAAETPAAKTELHIGAATADITPTGPVAICGMFDLRIAKNIETPLAASVLVLESRADDRSLDTAVMVSCDLSLVSAQLQRMVREATQQRLPDLDTTKLFLTATHTHTAPVVVADTPFMSLSYPVPETGVVQVDAYSQFLAERVAKAVEKAWKGRKPGSVTWGLAHAVVAQNRRGVFADGHHQMLGNTNRPGFRGIEGYEDHNVDILFFWHEAEKPVAMAVDVSCPAQQFVGKIVVNADYWHPARESLRQRYGADLCVLGLIGAAGDQCPDQRPFAMYCQNAEERMRTLRKLAPVEELTRRIVHAVTDAYEVVKDDRHANIPLIHKVETIRLPMRLVTEPEYHRAKAASEQAADRIAKDPKAAAQDYLKMKWYGAVARRFEIQKTNPKPTYEIEMHVLRIGDVAICTNPFELYTNYGVQIKARSPAIQTFVVQLTGDFGGYLPTKRAVPGGGYSAEVESTLVGPEGGQILVDRTVELLNSMWAKPK